MTSARPWPHGCRPAIATALLAVLAQALVLGIGSEAVCAEVHIELTKGELLNAPAEKRKSTIESRTLASSLSWPAGHVTLQQVATLLNDKNATRLGEGVDGTQVRDIAAFSGNYWQGVIALCTAFDLVLDRGLTLGYPEEARNVVNRGETEGTVSIAQGGDVVLSLRPEKVLKPLYVACGAVLAEITTFEIRQNRVAGGTTTSADTTMDILVKTRFEPHVQSAQIGRVRLLWTEGIDERGRKLKIVEPTASDGPQAEAPLRFTGVPDHLASIQLTGVMLIEQLESFELVADLQHGDKGTIKLTDKDVDMRIVDDKDVAANRGGRVSSLTMTFPESLLWSYPTLRITKGGANEPCGLSNWGTTNERTTVTYVCRKLEDIAYHFICNGQMLVEESHVPLRCVLQTSTLPSTEAVASPLWALETATQVSWPATTGSVRDAVRLLATHDNAVLLELGVDEQHSADLPAFSGTFWDGVQVVCRTYGLTMITPPMPQTGNGTDAETQRRNIMAMNGQPVQDQVPTYVCGGPLILGTAHAGRSALEAFRANGPLLVLVENVAVNTDQGLSGVRRKADITFRVRFEPHFDMAMITNAAVEWASSAGMSEGHPLVVESVPMPEQQGTTSSHFHVHIVRRGNRFVQVVQQPNEDGQDPENPGGQVTVSGLPAGSASIDLPGQMSVSLSRDVHAEIKLSVGATGIAHLEGRAIGVHLFANGDNDDTPGRMGVSLNQGSESPEMLVVQVIGSNNEPVHILNGFQDPNNSMQKNTRYLSGLIPGEYTIRISTTRALVRFCLPINLVTKTP